MKAFIISTRKIEESEKERKNLDKIGGDPTHLPPEELYDNGYFLMQIYNDKKIWPYKEGVLCWQFYQEEKFGGNIGTIIEVPEGAKLNIEKKIKRRRWLNEYVMEYHEEDEVEDDTLSDEEYLAKYYCNSETELNIFYRSKVGGYFGEEIKWYKEEGYQYVAMLMNNLADGEINLGIERNTIVINKNTEKLEIGLI